MRVVGNNSQSNYTDAELIDLLKKSHKGIMDIIYYKHMDSAIRFMKKRYDDEDICMDVYQESMAAVHKNVLDPEFKLDTDFQGYINRICRNQLLNRIKIEEKQNAIQTGDYFLKKTKNNSDSIELYNEANISSRPNTIKKTFEEEIFALNIDNIALFNRIKNKMKDLSTKCYEIINRIFLMQEPDEFVANEMDFKDKIAFKSKKSKCLKKLKVEALKIKIHS
jgi:DNA-directed RNA polymerase specialized sigma24 family protein